MAAMRHPILATLLVAVWVFGTMTAIFHGDVEALVIFCALAIGAWWGAARRAS